MLKIAVLSPVAWRTPPRHYGPWEQMASNLTEGLVRQGYEVILFATGDSLTTAKLAAVCKEGYEEDRTQDAKVIECLHISAVMERAHEFDIIHNHFDFLPLTYSRLIKTPIVTTIHGFSSPRILPVYQKYNDTSHYVSISDSNRSPLLRYERTVYNGLDPALFPFQAESQDYLLFFGRIHPDKGTHEAIQIAVKSGRKLIIAGIVQDNEYFREKIEPWLNEDITFIGHAGPDRRAQLLGNAYALLHPIFFDEPFGLSIAEAMLCGTPVIAFNRGAMPELIADGHTGFLVKNTGEAVERLKDIDSISRLNCHQWAVARFSTVKMIEGYEEVYERIFNP